MEDVFKAGLTTLAKTRNPSSALAAMREAASSPDRYERAAVGAFCATINSYEEDSSEQSKPTFLTQLFWRPRLRAGLLNDVEGKVLLVSTSRVDEAVNTVITTLNLFITSPAEGRFYWHACGFG